MLINRAGVVGYPAEHSLSPAIHLAGYRIHGIDWNYQAHTVSPEEFPDFVRRCAESGEYAGLSVTAPHKEAVLNFGKPDNDVELLGCANTLIFGKEPALTNTDVSGFVRAVERAGLGEPSSVTIIGAGATARSALLAFARLGASRFTVIARNPAKATKLCRLADRLGVRVQAKELSMPTGHSDLLVSTVPANALAESALSWSTHTESIFEVVYDPWPTPLSEAGRQQKMPVLDGLDLLAGQAVDQFRLFTGLEMSFRECWLAAEQELLRRQQS